MPHPVLTLAETTPVSSSLKVSKNYHQTFSALDCSYVYLKVNLVQATYATIRSHCISEREARPPFMWNLFYLFYSVSSRVLTFNAHMLSAPRGQLWVQLCKGWSSLRSSGESDRPAVGGVGNVLWKLTQPACTLLARSPPGIYRPHKMHSCIYGCYKNAIPCRCYDFQKS